MCLPHVLHAREAKPQYDINFIFFDEKRANAFNQKQSFEIDFLVKESAQALLSKKIEFKVMPSQRIWVSLRSNEPSCSPAKIKTNERVKEFLFSHPTGITASSRVYTRHTPDEIKVVLNKRGEIVSLDTLSKYLDDFILFHTAHRSYGNFMDEQIRALDKKYRSEIVSSHSFNSEVELFLAKRSSFLVSTPIVLHRAFPDVLVDYSHYRIQGSPSFSLGHIMCNDTKQTRAFLEEFNQALEQLHQSGRYTQIQIEGYPSTLHSEMNDLLRESGLIDSLELNGVFN
jgi:uncharacterized protein (TIGR02285 family)